MIVTRISTSNIILKGCGVDSSCNVTLVNVSYWGYSYFNITTCRNLEHSMSCFPRTATGCRCGHGCVFKLKEEESYVKETVISAGILGDKGRFKLFRK